jgi:hypothetical protein
MSHNFWKWLVHPRSVGGFSSHRLAVSTIMVTALGALVIAISPLGRSQTAPDSVVAPSELKGHHRFQRLLTAKQRKARAEYWARRRGVQFGVPPGAYRDAVEAMRTAETLGAFATAPNVMTPSWTFVGPQPMQGEQANFGGNLFGPAFNATGRITAIATDPTTTGRLFVGEANGGVWMSTDSGSTFTPISDSLSTTAIGAIALDTVNTNPPTIYVATGEGNNSGDSYYGQGMFASTDLGAHWTALAGGTFDHVGFTRLAVDASHNPPHLFAATTAFSGSASRADALFSEGNLTKGGLWRSTNGGTSWTQYSAATFGCELFNNSSIPCPATDVVIDPSNPMNVYAAIEFDNVFKSTDGGTSFSPVCFTNDAPTCTFPSALSQMDRPTIAVAPSLSSTVYAMIGAPDQAEYVGFFKSTDSGAHWTAETVPTVTLGPTTIDGTSSLNFSQSFYDQTLLVSPTDATKVFFGGVGIYESTNSGSTWSFLAQNGGTHSDEHALAVAPDNDTIYLGNDGGAYKFTISGISMGIATFTSLNSTLSAGQIQGIAPHPTDNTKLLAGFQDNGTLLDTGSLGWASVETGDGGITLFDHSDPTHAYHTFAAGGTSVPYGVSANGGVTWSEFNQTFSGTDPGFSFYPALASDPNNAGHVLVGGHFVWVLNAPANTVTQQSSQDLTGGCNSGRCALQDIEFVPGDQTRAWTVSMQTGATPFKVFNTVQAKLSTGATWTDVTADLPFNTDSTQATGIAPDPNHTQTAYLSISGFSAATGIGHIFKTTDFGAHWSRDDGNGGGSPLPDVPVLRILVDKSDATGNTLYAGTDIGVFRSTDGGATWSAFNLGVIPPVPVFDLEQNDNGVIFAGTHGRGAFESNSSGATPTPTPTATSTGATSTPTPTPSMTPTATPTSTVVPVALKWAPAVVNCGKASVGVPTKPKRLTLSNPSKTGGPTISLTGGVFSHDFGFFASGTTCIVSITQLAPKQKCTIEVGFQPPATGTEPGTLTVTDDASNAPQRIPLTGTGK